jgi:hypothetical protein
MKWWFFCTADLGLPYQHDDFLARRNGVTVAPKRNHAQTQKHLYPALVRAIPAPIDATKPRPTNLSNLGTPFWHKSGTSFYGTPTAVPPQKATQTGPPKHAQAGHQTTTNVTTKSSPKGLQNHLKRSPKSHQNGFNKRIQMESKTHPTWGLKPLPNSTPKSDSWHLQMWTHEYAL